jgi:hypothetical protein
VCVSEVAICLVQGQSADTTGTTKLVEGLIISERTIACAQEAPLLSFSNVEIERWQAWAVNCLHNEMKNLFHSSCMRLHSYAFPLINWVASVTSYERSQPGVQRDVTSVKRPWNAPGPKRDFVLSLGFALQRASSRMLRNADRRRRNARGCDLYSAGTRPSSSSSEDAY